jgi:hypothetical protein
VRGGYKDEESIEEGEHISKIWFDGFPYLKRGSCDIAICMKTKPIFSNPAEAHATIDAAPDLRRD